MFLKFAASFSLLILFWLDILNTKIKSYYTNSKWEWRKKNEHCQLSIINYSSLCRYFSDGGKTCEIMNNWYLTIDKRVNFALNRYNKLSHFFLFQAKALLSPNFEIWNKKKWDSLFIFFYRSFFSYFSCVWWANFLYFQAIAIFRLLSNEKIWEIAFFLFQAKPFTNGFDNRFVFLLNRRFFRVVFLSDFATAFFNKFV